MKAISDWRVTVLFASGAAMAFAAVSIVLGYSWPATIVSVFLGAGAGYWVARRMLTKQHLTYDTSFDQLARLYRQGRSDPRDSARGILSSRKILANGPESHTGAFLFGLFRSLPKYQRWASAIFLFQAMLSLLTIGAFWIMQSAGLDIQIMFSSSVGEFFDKAFPIGTNSAIARTRFDHLFVPLSCIYILSLTSLAVAAIHSLGPLLRESRKHGPLLLGIAVFFIFFASFLFQTVDYVGAGSLKRHILDGDVWGYFVFFCLFPFVGIFLAAELPEKR